MVKDKISVLFQPSGRRGEIKAGKTVLQAAQELGAPLESVCGGKHTCGKCKVRVQGRAAEKADLPGIHLSPFSPEEGKFISPEERKAGYRLGCVVQL